MPHGAARGCRYRSGEGNPSPPELLDGPREGGPIRALRSRHTIHRSVECRSRVADFAHGLRNLLSVGPIATGGIGARMQEVIDEPKGSLAPRFSVIGIEKEGR